MTWHAKPAFIFLTNVNKSEKLIHPSSTMVVAVDSSVMGAVQDYLGMRQSESDFNNVLYHDGGVEAKERIEIFREKLGALNLPLHPPPVSY